jgi:hypothetical protein
MSLAVEFDFELPAKDVKQLTGAGMIVPDFAPPRGNPFLDDREIGAVQKAPAFASDSP